MFYYITNLFYNNHINGLSIYAFSRLQCSFIFVLGAYKFMIKVRLNETQNFIFSNNSQSSCVFLAHLSRRLTGELIVYPWSGVRRRPSVVRPSYVVRRPSFTMLKHLLLRNRLADQSQILCGASLARGNEILFAASGSHDQDGRHAHIW